MHTTSQRSGIAQLATGLLATGLLAGSAFGQSAAPTRQPIAVLKDPFATTGDSVGWQVGIENGFVYSGGWGGVFSTPDSGIGMRFSLDSPTSPLRFGPDFLDNPSQFGRNMSVGGGVVAATVRDGTGTFPPLGVAVYDATTTINSYYIEPQGDGDRISIAHPVIEGPYLAARVGLPNSQRGIQVFQSQGGELVTTLRQTPGQLGTRGGFAESIAIEGSLLVAGHTGVTSFGTDPDQPQGAMLFEISSGQQFAEIVSPVPMVNQSNVVSFGAAIAISNGLLAVGAPDLAYGSNFGRVYIYNTATLELMHTLIGPDSVGGDAFGAVIAADDGLLVVTAYGLDPSDTDCPSCPFGKAYLYDMLSGDLLTTFVIPSGINPQQSGDRDTALFGLSAAIDDNLVAIGAPRAINEPFNTQDTGAIAVYEAIPDCTADTNADGQLDPSDFLAWIIAYNNGGAACDQNSDGLCTPADFNAWLLNYRTGCIFR